MVTTLISLPEARQAVGLPTSTTNKDAELTGYLAAATPIIEDIVGPILSRQCDEWHDGGALTVRLMQAPCVSITLVEESFGNYVRALTEQTLDGTGFDAYGYTVDLVDGTLHRRTSGTASFFAGGRRNVHVSYVAGRAAVPENVKLATRRLIKHYWQHEQGLRPNMGAPDGTMATSPSGFAVPKVVVDMCAAEARVVGIA